MIQTSPGTAKSHCIITGTGRSGTTFLVQLLTHLNFDTGYDASSLSADINPVSNGGLERNIFHPKAPYIVKNPRFCDIADTVLTSPHMSIDHIFLTIRDLRDASASRQSIHSQGIVEGGLWDCIDPNEQAIVLVGKLYKLIYSCSLYQKPLNILRFPLLALDAHYTYQKLLPLVGHIDYEYFSSVFESVSNPGLIHEFQ